MLRRESKVRQSVARTGAAHRGGGGSEENRGRRKKNDNLRHILEIPNHLLGYGSVLVSHSYFKQLVVYTVQTHILSEQFRTIDQLHLTHYTQECVNTIFRVTTIMLRLCNKFIARLLENEASY